MRIAPGVSRWHDVIRLPKSRVIVLRLQRCWIDVDDDKKRSSMVTPRTSESDVLQLMGARFSGYEAYSWSYNNSPFAFTKENLVGAKVKYNNNNNSYVYIVYSSLLPWQRVAKKGSALKGDRGMVNRNTVPGSQHLFH